ncbi:translation elongation factor Tu [Emergomyces africanus]|uniref:Elongation factor 1 alpha-like protein n=1 Tax=Emergomyces africanus TaxID=1955775 RepID=A0A1B7NPD1_9EURO|nr:translation elongation factor Tu [Emergomyces africanus]
MSRNRIKNIAYDDDDFASASDDDGIGSNDMTPEDREQMRQCTIEVREQLDADTPPVPASDEEIWESLWYYYYDVEKTAGWLRRTTTSLTPFPFPSQSPYPIPTCPEPFSAADFFKDSPWLNVPASRKADILIEPLYPPLGLLGGAPEPSGKVSKLAALAARKRKDGERRAMAADAISGSTGAAGNEASSSPPASDGQRGQHVSLLERLAVGGKSQGGPTPARPVRLPLRSGGKGTLNMPPKPKPIPIPIPKQGFSTSPGPAGVPNATTPSSDDAEPPPPSLNGKRNAAAMGAAESTDQEERPHKLLDLRAEPSAFAMVLVGSRRVGGNGRDDDDDDGGTPLPNPISHNIDVMQFFGQDLTEAFDFVEPSPDDIVIKARESAKGNKLQNIKTKRTAASKSPGTNKDVADAVGQLSVQETVKVKSKNIDVLAEYHKAERKKAANFVVIGHVDAGKSTLMGRLLYELKAVDQRTIDKYKKDAERIGKGSFALAWVLDQGSEERARGVTIDIATNQFATENTNFTILDAPGHRDFVPNMIAGASQADFAVLVLDATTGNFESGLKGQTKEHALLVRSMGVQKIVVAVNKMDAAEWSQARFDEMQQQIASFLTTAGFQEKNISFVPCSGLRGDNVVQRPTDKTASWYTGKTLIEELDSAEPYTYALDKPLRMTIANVFRGGVQNPLSISGRLNTGHLQVGDQLTTMPSGETCTIRSLEVDHRPPPSDWAVAGENVTLHLTDIDPVHVRIGDILCSPSAPVANITSFTAKVLAFDHLTPMHIDVHRGRLHVPGRISQLVALLDKGTGQAVKKKPKIVGPGSVARIVVEMEQAIPLEAPGRIVLRAGGETVAAGLLE